jgi:hypothetical protein
VTCEPDPLRSGAWWEGWRQGLDDRATGAVTLICGGSQEAHDKAEGYGAGRQLGGRQRVPEREAGS